MAKQGVQALGNYFKQHLTKEQRQIIGANETQRIKALAEQYEQGNIQEAEYEEV